MGKIELNSLCYPRPRHLIQSWQWLLLLIFKRIEHIQHLIQDWKSQDSTYSKFELTSMSFYSIFNLISPSLLPRLAFHSNLSLGRISWSVASVMSGRFDDLMELARIPRRGTELTQRKKNGTNRTVPQAISHNPIKGFLRFTTRYM